MALSRDNSENQNVIIKQSETAEITDTQKTFEQKGSHEAVLTAKIENCTLVCRLSDLGVSCAALRWFKNYLTDRHHCAKCQNQFSSWQKMKGGIPGHPTRQHFEPPLIFSIYEYLAISYY